MDPSSPLTDVDSDSGGVPSSAVAAEHAVPSPLPASTLDLHQHQQQQHPDQSSSSSATGSSINLPVPPTSTKTKGRGKRTSIAASIAQTTQEQQPRKRRAVTKRAIIESDDEDKPVRGDHPVVEDPSTGHGMEDPDSATAAAAGGAANHEPMQVDSPSATQRALTAVAAAAPRPSTTKVTLKLGGKRLTPKANSASVQESSNTVPSVPEQASVPPAVEAQDGSMQLETITSAQKDLPVQDESAETTSQAVSAAPVKTAPARNKGRNTRRQSQKATAATAAMETSATPALGNAPTDLSNIFDEPSPGVIPSANPTPATAVTPGPDKDSPVEALEVAAAAPVTTKEARAEEKKSMSPVAVTTKPEAESSSIKSSRKVKEGFVTGNASPGGQAVPTKKMKKPLLSGSARPSRPSTPSAAASASTSNTASKAHPVVAELGFLDSLFDGTIATTDHEKQLAREREEKRAKAERERKAAAAQAAKLAAAAAATTPAAAVPVSATSSNAKPSTPNPGGSTPLKKSSSLVKPKTSSSAPSGSSTTAANKPATGVRPGKPSAIFLQSSKPPPVPSFARESNLQQRLAGPDFVRKQQDAQRRAEARKKRDEVAAVSLFGRKDA